MQNVTFESLLTRVTAWAAGQPDIVAVALVGSHARGTARPNSDVDLVILTATPERFLSDTGWTSHFGQAERQAIEHWGRVTSLRVWFAEGVEVEFAFTTPDWAAAPLDEGTRPVVQNGIRTLFDRSAVLATLAGT